MRGRSLAALRRFDRAAREFDLARSLAPDDPGIAMEAHRCRGGLRLDRRDFVGAAEEFGLARKLGLDDPDIWRYEACARFLAGERKTYRSLCEGMLERFGTTADPATAYCVASTCVYAPDAVRDPQRLLAVARKGASWYPGADRSLAAALCRAGRHAEAVEVFASAELLHRRRAWDWALLTIALRRLGRDAEAAAALDRAKTLLREREKDVGAWDDQAIEPFLVEEAERLVEGR